MLRNYVYTLEPKPDTCVDVQNFNDINGDTCDTVKQRGDCKDGKTTDTNWGKNFIKFGMDANDAGVSASSACCICGGGQGKEKKQESNVASCVDIPNYKDKYLTTCEKTKEFGNCKDGKPHEVPEATLKSDANVDGVSPLDACCVCGGGLKFKLGEDKGENSIDYRI